MKTKSLFKKFSAALLALFLVLTVVCSSEIGKTVLAVADGDYVAPSPVFGNYFHADYTSKTEAWKAADDLNEKVCEEGFTLLKNEGDALPLGEGAKISVFGKSSVNMLYGLSSNYVDGYRNARAPMITLQQSLTEAGLIVNPSLTNFYNDNTLSGNGRGAQPTNGANVKGYHTGETPIANYSADLEESYEDYSDAALIVISRSGGEGWDLPKTMTWNGSSYTSGGTSQKVDGARNADDHYLQLDQNETDLIKYVGDRFDKVIVIFNTPNTFETGFLDDPGHYAYHENLKAAIYMGYPGRTGIYALGRILSGEVNPSGKTVDTWYRDFKLDPTFNNFGVYSLSGAGNYVAYKEGIYVGYRYYETRGFVEGDEPYSSADDGQNVIHGTTTTQWDSWYDASVIFPFAHGLSYTTFDQQIVGSNMTEGSAITADTVIDLSVKVTNTGSVAGKETALVFFTAPYYDGGIEKAHVVLGGFTKTKLLEPGESETVVVSVKARDMASYDYSDANANGFKGYELEHGTYSLKLMRNAHDLIEKRDFVVNADIKIETSETTGYKIENQFEDLSDFVTGYLNEVYLSRGDFEGTFPKAAKTVTATSDMKTAFNKWTSGNIPADSTLPNYVESADIKFGDDTGDIKLRDLFKADYDDPLWDKFLDQLSEASMKDIVAYGSYVSGKDIPALGITRVINAGQPAGYMALFKGMNNPIDGNYAFWSSDTITASTYNTELAYNKGIAMGNEALFGTGNGKSRFPGWYAPSADTHRSPFGGRCADYFSEDGFVAGKMASEIIKGANEKGVFTFFKHFALNEQENSRIGISTWANEQSIREIYLRPFEIAVKEGHTTAIMSALNRVGATWSGGHYGLLTEVLRNEWGFHGTVVTDSYVGLSKLDQMIKSGGDLALGSATGEYSKLGSASSGTMTPTTYLALRNANHNILYTMANSMAINTGYATPPQVLTAYEGQTLAVGLMNTAYNADLATVHINSEAFLEGDEIPEDSEIVYSLKEGSALPSGLTLSPSGLLSGVPNEEATSHQFTVVATYGTNSVEATFNISVIDVNGSIVYSPVESTFNNYINEETSFNVATAEIVKRGATEEEIAAFPTITYELEKGCYLPEGLTLNKNGTIVGTPTKECLDYEFTVIASALGFRSVKQNFRLQVVNRVALNGSVLSAGKINSAYLTYIGGSDKEVTYSLKEGESLPVGLTLTKGGYITGTPKVTVKDAKFIVVATKPFGELKEAEFTLSIGIKYSRVDSFATITGEDLYYNIAAAQGADDVVYTAAPNMTMPNGVELSEDGIVSGKFLTAGIYDFNIVATSETMGSDEISFKIFVEEAPETPVIDDPSHSGSQGGGNNQGGNSQQGEKGSDEPSANEPSATDGTITVMIKYFPWWIIVFVAEGAVILVLLILLLKKGKKEAAAVANDEDPLDPDPDDDVDLSDEDEATTNEDAFYDESIADDEEKTDDNSFENESDDDFVADNVSGVDETERSVANIERSALPAAAKTLREQFAELWPEQRVFFEKIRTYATSKPKVSVSETKEYLTVSLGRDKLVRLRIRRNFVEALFFMKDNTIKDALSDAQINTKESVSVMRIASDKDLENAIKTVDLKYDAIVADRKTRKKTKGVENEPQ